MTHPEDGVLSGTVHLMTVQMFISALRVVEELTT